MSDKYDIKMITQSDCKFCKEAKKHLKEKIRSGKIKILEVDTDDKAMDFAMKMGIDEAPTIVIENKITKLQETCDLSDDYKSIICKNKKIDI